MPNGIEEKRKSIINSESEILEGRIIANYNDPGLLNTYHFDLLSRFVIVAIESAFRVPTTDRWQDVFAVVATPENLWISAPEGKASSVGSQSRTDALGNISAGVPGSFSTSGIPNTNQPYRMGELIKFKKLSAPFNIETATAFFLSVFPDIGDALVYPEYHTEGSTLNYFANNQSRIDGLRYKNINQTSADTPLKYNIRLWKYQYEAFFLDMVKTDSNMLAYASAIFSNTLPNSDPIYQGNGGYVFSEQSYVDIFNIAGIDLNLSQKARISENSCLPTIVSTPNQFPTPRTRTLSTISYNPTYSTIIQQ